MWVFMIGYPGHRVLVCDDQATVLESLSRILHVDGYQVSVAKTGQEAIAILGREPINLLITDLQMPGMGGMELLEEVLREWPNVPVMILTAHGSVESAVEAMRLGAVDFLTKPIEPKELTVRLQKRLDERNLRTEIFRLSSEVRRSGRYGEIIGANKRMREIFEVIERVAKKPFQVLIQGEPGTGKERIARAIHNRSLENKLPEGLSEQEREHLTKMGEVRAPYIAVNCGAFSRNLLESQLFGHKKGTFTGAIADQEGVFVAARNGTLFLDEITEIDFDLQVKLLRAIQEREVTPLGSTQPVPISARIITATNQDIAKLVERNEFRPDLFYRVNVVNIQIPPLRERVDDIPLLVDFFLKSIAKAHSLAPREVTQPVMEAFQSYDWPGNVRELQNVIERAFALGKDDRRITLDDLPQELLRACGGSAGIGDNDQVFPTYDSVVRDHIVRALQASGGVKSRAAGMLRIDRNRLYRLMEKYAIEYER